VPSTRSRRWSTIPFIEAAWAWSSSDAVAELSALAALVATTLSRTARLT